MRWPKSESSIFRERLWSSAKWLSVPYFATAILASGCATPSTPPLPVVQCPEPRTEVVKLACPEALEPMADDTMGSAVEALMSAAEQYHACRKAAVAQW